MPLSIYQKIGFPELTPSKAYVQVTGKTQSWAAGELDNYLIRIGELFVPVDFVVLDIEDEEEPCLQLGRPFMETTKMEINMRDGILKMTVLGKTLKVDITDEDAPPTYKARYYSSDFDETEIDKVLNSMQGIQRQARHLGVQKGVRVRGEARKPWKIGTTGHLHKDHQINENQGDFSLNSQQYISNNDAAKRKHESMENDRDDGDGRKKKNSFRNLEDEGGTEKPRDQGNGPNEEEVDQPSKNPP